MPSSVVLTPRRRRLGRWLRVLAGLLLTALGLAHVLGFNRLHTLDRLEARSYDLRIDWLPRAGGDAGITILDIDDLSLQEYGQWPWPRERLAELVHTLFEHYRVAVIGFDVVFAEPDRSTGLATLQALAQGPLAGNRDYLSELQRLTPELDGDGRFAAAMAAGPVVLGYYFRLPGQLGSTANAGQLPAPMFTAAEIDSPQSRFREAEGYGANLPVLQQAARAGGHFSHYPEVDGVLRSMPLLMRYRGDYYGSLSLAVAQQALGNAPLNTIHVEAQGYRALEALELAGRLIPLDERGQALLPFRGPAGSFPYVPVRAALHRAVPPEALKGRIVLVGTSAAGLLDLRTTPVGVAYPGVEAHANMIAAILEGTMLQRPPWVQGYELLLVGLCGGLLALLLPFCGPWGSLALALGAGGLTMLPAILAWQAGLVLPLASALAVIALLFFSNELFGLFAETRARRQVAALFGQYVPPKVVSALSENPELASMEGESRVMTVLFSDIKGFTPISERLSPVALTRLMNEYLNRMTDVVQQQQGTVDKYIGDAIMAFWGAPLPDPQHAEHAVLTALGMQAAAAKLRESYRARGLPELHVGIGINTGNMVVGNMGSDFRRAYTVMGDSVNLGARLESLTRQYDLGILVGEATAAACPNILFREIDQVLVKGKSIPATVFEPLAPRTEASPEQLRLAECCAAFHQALRAGERGEAARQLELLATIEPNAKLLQRLGERLAQLGDQAAAT